VLDFDYGDMAVTTGERSGARYVYRTPAPEFELSRLEWTSEADPVTLACGTPRILVTIDGAVDAGDLTLGRGQSVWIPASDPDVVLTPAQEGTRAFVATPGA
jgi:mannose-6-phosphate isomerase